jgi:hypothetical protein
MAFNISEFVNNLEQGGARSSLFQVQINNPVDASADLKMPFMVRAASLPGSSIGFTELPYFGRTTKVAGQRRYDDWAVTVINDEDFKVRHAMENWINALNSHEDNLRDSAYVDPSSYKYRGLFPVDVSLIGLDWGQTDVIEEFNVTFKYDFYTVDGQTGEVS